MHFTTFSVYLDPGTGSIVIQSVIGVVAGVAFFGRRFFGGLRNKIRSIFSIFSRSPVENPSNSADRK